MLWLKILNNFMIISLQILKTQMPLFYCESLTAIFVHYVEYNHKLVLIGFYGSVPDLLFCLFYYSEFSQTLHDNDQQILSWVQVRQVG